MARLEEHSLDAAQGSLLRAVKRAVKDVGADPEHGRLHLVLAFSTGHLSQDPLAGEAARRIAEGVLRRLPAGDRVSFFAWEQGLWKHDARAGEPQELPSAGDTRGWNRIHDLLPKTPQAGSTGGHDTERALLELRQRLGDAQDVVVLLLTNTAASIAPAGGHVLGTDSPDYRRLLAEWHRRPAVSPSGASVVIPYQVITAQGAVTQRSLDAVLLTPRRLVLPSLDRGNGLLVRLVPWGIVSVLLVLGGWLVTRRLVQSEDRWIPGWLSRSRSPRVEVLRVGDRDFLWAEIADGDEICLFAGPRYAEAADRAVVVQERGRGPLVPIARLCRRGNRLEAAALHGDFRVEYRGSEYPKTCPLPLPTPGGEPLLLSLVGRDDTDPRAVARQASYDVTISAQAPGTEKAR